MILQRKRFYVFVGGLTSLLLFLHFLGVDLFATTSRTGNEDALPLPKNPVLQTEAQPAIGHIPPPSSGKEDTRILRWEDLRVQYPVISYIPLPAGRPEQLPKIQHEFPTESAEAQKIRLERQAAVKKVFERCWKTYKSHAWKLDEVSPISGKGNHWYGGWGATLVDSLDTLWIMDLKNDFQEAVKAAAKINFGPKSSKLDDINVFETNIRYLGGFLGAYDLSGDKRLLEKAREVGEMVYVAFDTPNRMPITRWKPRDAAAGRKQEAVLGILSAELGSFSMEFTRLSQLTKDPKWFDAAQRITNGLYESQSHTRLPGMWDLVLNAREMNFTGGGTFKLGAMADSMYEYFPKTYALLGGLSSIYKGLYEDSAAAAIKHTIFKPMTPDNADILIPGEIYVDSNGKFTPKLNGEHLGCFVGGMLGLGGKLIGNDEHLDVARKLTEGCIWTYRNNVLGIGPETFEMVPCPKSSHCAWSDEKWKEAIKAKHGLEEEGSKLDQKIEEMRLPKGFVAIPDTRYILRPEAIESVFILYRITGDTSLLEAAWEMFSAIDKYTKTDLANAALVDMTVAKDPPKEDRMESFWFAETLKYFYLIFSEPDLISLDEYVFNTEAHPFKRPV